MSVEVNFYHLVSSSLLEALPKLLEQILSKDYKVLVLCVDKEQMKALDEKCWTYSSNVFLPHATIDDPYPDEQPILFSLNLDNINKANLLVNLGKEIDLEKLSFSKIVDIFDSKYEAELAAARKRYKLYSNKFYKITYYKQNDKGRWEKNK
jgi:DNA polymerase-3 subunit chi